VILVPSSKAIGKVFVVGFVIWLVLEGPDIYRRYKARQNPEAEQMNASDPLVTADKEEDDEDDDESNGDAPREEYTPPPPVSSSRVSAQALAATARPDQAYEAMQTGAVLRELDERKHRETTAVARELVPKLDAETKRHEEELAQLDECRAACTDEAAIERIDTQKAEREHAHHARLKEIEADAMLALADVERAHDQAIASCQASSTLEMPSEQRIIEHPKHESRPDEAAEMAKLAAHQQAAMKIVAQHMMQQMDAATAQHERLMSRLKDQLAELGATNASMNQRMHRATIEKQIKDAERAHAEQLASLEQKASVALLHVEEQHQRALAKLKQETRAAQHDAMQVASASGEDSRYGNSKLQGNGDTLQAEALQEWSQLEDQKKARMRAEAERLMAQMHQTQTQHDEAVAAVRERAEKATTEAARALFNEDLRLREEQHSKELEQLEAQATKSLATIEQEFSGRAVRATAASKPPGLPSALSQARSSQVMSGALVLASHSQGTRLQQSEARKQAITWLGGQECTAIDTLPASDWNAVAHVADGRPKRQASSSRLRVAARSPAVRVANSPAANRARAVRQAYETLGVDRNIADSDLNRVYAALMHKENPENNPPECAGYYAKKTKEIRAAYACLRSNRRPSAEPEPSSAVSARASSFSGGTQADLGV